MAAPDRNKGDRRYPDIPPEMGEYICPFCGRIFSTHAELHRHVRREHRDRPKLA
jgi:hypothetical protein